jgi:polyvinyl alcohol dehydrogenase (cytochrome)
MRRRFWPFAALLVLGTFAGEARAQTADGAALFDRHCAACHVGSDIGRAPDRKALAERTPESILDALVTGPMAVQGAALSDAERRTLSEYLTGRRLGTDPRPTAQRCAAGPASADLAAGPRWNGWGADLTNTRFQSADQARVPADRVANLRLKWAFGFPGASSARAQPAVAGGRLFGGSESGVVYALDARTGFTYWSYTA